MRITLLGTGSPLPDPNRAGPSTLVSGAGTHLLVDAGRGVLMRLAGALVAPGQLGAVLLTHLHSDHICDLNDVITSRWVTSMAPAPLTIYGPPGTAAVVDAVLAMLGPDIGYRLAHHDDLNEAPPVHVIEVEPGDRFDVANLAVTVGRTDHRPVEPTVGFRIDDGQRSVVIGGDGIPCDTLDALCSGADAYVQSVIRDDLVRAVPVARFVDICDYHSNVADAAATAARAGVTHLVLTHYVPAPAPDGYDEWRVLAAADFDGQIHLGDDGLTVDL